MRVLVWGQGKNSTVVKDILNDMTEHTCVDAVGREAALHYLKATFTQSPPNWDVIIDFSLPQGTMAALDLCRKVSLPLVTATTGLSESQQQKVEAAALDFPIFQAANFSLGVAYVNELVGQLSRYVPTGTPCQVYERHRVGKQDSPSGTALALGQTVKKHAPQSEVTFTSKREGDVVGEHEVTFTLPHEEISIAHRAADRKVFANGAIKAAAWLCDKPVGLYGVKDLVKIQG